MKDFILIIIMCGTFVMFISGLIYCHITSQRDKINAIRHELAEMMKWYDSKGKTESAEAFGMAIMILDKHTKGDET